MYLLKYLLALLLVLCLAGVSNAQCKCGPNCASICANGCTCIDSYESCMAALAAVPEVRATKSSFAAESQWHTYASLWERALKENLILVIGVNCDPPVGNWLSCRVDEFADFPAGVVVGKAGNVLAKLPVGASAAQCAGAACPPQSFSGFSGGCANGQCGVGFGGMMGGSCAGGSCGSMFGGMMGGCSGGRCR